jgi:hypothetical protein
LNSTRIYDKPIHKTGFYLFLMFFILLQSCQNEVKVNAEWKEVPVIYGLLDPNSAINYIRINRVFLNESGAAISYASEPDSIYFPDLTVELTEFKDGAPRKTFTLERVMGDSLGLPKDSGIFANAPNYLYRVNEPIQASSFAGIYSYTLKVTNNQSGQVCTAETITGGLMELFSPIRMNDPEINITDDSTKSMAISYREGAQVAAYDLVVKFRYAEYTKEDKSDMKMDSVIWRMFQGKETRTLRGYEITNEIVSQSIFYYMLRSNLEADSTIKREALNVDFIFYGAGEDLYTYVQVNKPSIGIVQKKPEFSNIENALGIFSSRYVTTFGPARIGETMQFTLTNSPITKDLNFVTP